MNGRTMGQSEPLAKGFETEHSIASLLKLEGMHDGLYALAL